MRLAVAEDVRDVYLEGLPAEVEVVRFPLEGPPGPRVLEAEFVVPTRRVMAEALKRMPRLEVVQTISAGVDWVLPHVPQGVTLADARGVHDVAVSEWVLAALLVWAKHLPELFEHQRQARWAGGLRPGELAGRTVLILGYGSIGRAVEARLAPFGVRLLRVARRPRAGVHGPDALPELLPRADAVVLLLPLTPATRGRVDADFLARMKPGALLANAGRGALVDTSALLEALRAGRVRAALDVTDPEPLPADHPLWRAPGVWITPHLAGSSPQLRARGFALVRAQVARYLEGLPLFNVVNEGY